MVDLTEAAAGGPGPRVLVLGGTGMLGHVMWQECEGRFDAYATVRGDRPAAAAAKVLDESRTLTGVRAEDPDSLERALEQADANVAVNCIGVVKQLAGQAGPAEMIRANALFPHQLAAICARRGTRLIQISTDCVFSGRKGDYAESDWPDCEDLYGRSKLLGEPGVGLTLRTSMIGRELDGAHGLLEWFLAQHGEVRGFTRAWFTGPTAPVLARMVCDLIVDHPELGGTLHFGGERIAKHDLLLLLRDAFDHDVEVLADDSVSIDRSLNSSRLRSATGWRPPSWEAMVAELRGAPAASHEARQPLAGR